MSYPLSSAVTAGQPTAADHYNNLRKDALRLSQADADAVPIGTFFQRFTQALDIDILATNRLRVPYLAINPPTVMIKGYMCQASADVDLPSGQFSGAAATWYIFAERSDGYNTFTLSVNTSGIETANNVIIGSCEWDGTNLTSVTPFYFPSDDAGGLPTADYDSGWFAVTTSTTYTKAHSLAQNPRLVMLFHATDSAGTSEWVLVGNVQAAAAADLAAWGCTSTNVIATSSSATGATCQSSRRQSNSGYWRILAWI